MTETRAEIGVIGGSGFYAFLEDTTTIEVETPFGAPSDPITIGTVGDRMVAFLPRHGTDHRFPPHLVPYRANLWALKDLGVSRVFGPCAAGSLRKEIPPRTLVSNRIRSGEGNRGGRVPGRAISSKVGHAVSANGQ